VRLQPGSADAHTGLGVALRDLGRRAEAEAAFAAVVALRPNCALALGNLAGMYYDQVRLPWCCQVLQGLATPVVSVFVRLHRRRLLTQHMCAGVLDTELEAYSIHSMLLCHSCALQPPFPSLHASAGQA
jgi:hypothetical protein